MVQPEAVEFLDLFVEERKLSLVSNRIHEIRDTRVPFSEITIIDEMGLFEKLRQNAAEPDIPLDDAEKLMHKRIRAHRALNYRQFYNRRLAITALNGCKPFIKVDRSDANHLKSPWLGEPGVVVVGQTIKPPANAQYFAFYMTSSYRTYNPWGSLFEVRPLTSNFEDLTPQISVEFLDE